jgi:acyl-[acyl-carrier-protein]-phospholipid O-acyltransferase / long-chain-fatty-acid--[acyl-carrier-protein] ligase
MSLIAALLRVIFRLLYRVEVRGELHPADRMVILPNHQSFLDPLLLGAFLPVSPTYVVHSSIINQWYMWPMRWIRHAVVDTVKPMAMKALVALVETGEPVLIFPEGRITVTGNLMKVYDGPSFVAAKTGCTLIPVYLDGPLYSPFGRMTGDFPRRWFPKVTITIGSPVTLHMPEARTAKERRRMASESLRRIMQANQYSARKKTTIFDALLDTAELHGRKRTVLEDINTNFSPVTYGTILKGSLALGRLTSRISSDREAVGVLMPNANATVYLLFGLTAFGRVAAMLNYTAGADGLRQACKAAQIRLVLTSRAFIEKANLGALIEKLEGLEIVYLEDLRARFSFGDKLWLILWALRNPRAVRKAARPDDPAAILFTSGSEGVPKGVVLSHDSILANVAQISAAYPFSSKDKFMSALPLFHAFGITAGILLPLLRGCKTVLYPSPLHYRTVPEFVYDHDCTVLFTTNTFLGKYAKVAHPYDFHNIRHLVVGAEKLTEDVQRLCYEKFGLRVLEGYGATECAPVISVATPYVNRAGSVGELLPGIEHRLTPVPGLGDGGVLHVKGDNVMLGYLRPDRPGVIEPPRSEFGEGWYNTGDVVVMNGLFVTITARLKRFAKIAGEMVSLEVVERIAGEARANGVHAAATYKDPGRGEGIVLFTDAKGLTRDEMKKAAQRLGAPDLAVPRRIVALAEIPLLGNGKKDYVTLSRMAQEPVGPEEILA